MSDGLVPIPRREIGRAGFENLPAIIGRAGEAAAWRFVEFFAARQTESLRHDFAPDSVSYGVVAQTLVSAASALVPTPDR